MNDDIRSNPVMPREAQVTVPTLRGPQLVMFYTKNGDAPRAYVVTLDDVMIWALWSQAQRATMGGILDRLITKHIGEWEGVPGATQDIGDTTANPGNTGLNIIKDMTPAQLIAEIIEHQKVTLQQMSDDALKEIVIKLRSSLYLSRLHDEAGFDTHDHGGGFSAGWM